MPISIMNKIYFYMYFFTNKNLVLLHILFNYSHYILIHFYIYK